VTGPNGVAILGSGVNASHQFTISFSGLPYASYAVQAVNSLNAQWQTIATNIADSNGMWQFTDTNAATAPSRFYRAAAQ
jgi:hypothetical protein